MMFWVIDRDTIYILQAFKHHYFLFFDSFFFLSFEEDQNVSSLAYSWHLVGVLDYCKEKGQYLVEKVHQHTAEVRKGQSSGWFYAFLITQYYLSIFYFLCCPVILILSICV